MRCCRLRALENEQKFKDKQKLEQEFKCTLNPSKNSSAPFPNLLCLCVSANMASVTVKVDRVRPDFDELPREQALLLLMENVVLPCEAKGIHLIRRGNVATPAELAEYGRLRAAGALFEVEAVQKLFALLPRLVTGGYRYKVGSYALKHVAEHVEPPYFSNGDTIAAMLLLGIPARFPNSNFVNCEFKAHYTRRGHAAAKGE